MAVLKGSPEPLMADPVQHVFFDHLRIRETYSFFLLSNHDNQDDHDDHCHHLQSRAHTSYPPTPHLGDDDQ